MNQHNPYAPPVAGDPTAAAEPPPMEVSVVAAIRWSFAGVGIGNLALGLLLLFIPMIGGVLLMGWVAEAHRRLALRVGPALPKFTFAQFGNFTMSGLPNFAVQMAISFVVMIPMMVVAGGGVALAVASGEPGIGVAVVVGLLSLVLCVALVPLTALSVAMITRGELTGSIKEAFNVRLAWAFTKRNFWGLIGHHLVLMLLAIPLSIAGMLALFIGIYFVAIALQFAGMHLRWQLYERDVAAGGERLQVRTQPGADL